MTPHLTTAALCVALLSGCSSSAFHYTDPQRHVIVLDQTPISVLQTNDDTWEAWGGKQSKPDNHQFEQQIKAIEIVSGCKVKSSDIDAHDARRLYATVRCKAPLTTL